jgi:hypothetical protein
MLKPVLAMYPYSKVYPPFTPDKQKLIRMLLTYLGCSQSCMVKKFIGFIIFILIIRGVATGRINKVFFNKWKNVISEIFRLLRKAIVG